MKRSVQILKLLVCLGLAAASLSLDGCASGANRFRTSGQYAQDQALADNVHNALSRAPVYKFPDVKVTAYRGRVQLSGFVANESQKQDAGRIASRVPGVSQVENDLLLKQAGVGGASSPGGGGSSR